MDSHLIVTDLDNTLLDDTHALDRFTIDTFRELDARGHHIALASGRHYHDIAAFRRHLGVPAYILSTNGAHLYAPDDTLIAEQWVPAAQVRRLVDMPREADVRLNFYTRDAWLIDAPAPELLVLHASTGFGYRVADLAAHDGEGVGKVLCIGRPESLARLEAAIRDALGEALHVTYSMADSLEIMAAGVNKGTALQRLLAHLALPAERCLAFGDNLNDTEMLALAGHAFVMDNAHPALTGHVPHAERIGHHHPDGVARRLRDFFALD
ncbi:HAD family hydrolase [Modicisalibacter tunisiensis]|uniref:HAD family hydrolase n=1 Tax=Modicisalibacter tunisiensis TaxID=390637 RepID=UPI000799CB08|nr:HAD family hydrolase [Modicisalibacter tunisiensis]KXS38376.1 MAG: Cof protein [Halomonadaceae bacterium T82-2]MBZ9537459.1 HAD family hydrolase [Modicisalibacter tunisiensis]